MLLLRCSRFADRKSFEEWEAMVYCVSGWRLESLSEKCDGANGRFVSGRCDGITIAVVIGINPLGALPSVGGCAIPALVLVVKVENKCSMAVVNPHLEISDSGGDRLYGVVRLGSRGENVWYVDGYAPKWNVSVCGVKACG